MANVTISVQSFLNSATKLSITIDNAQTVTQLKTAINTAEGTPTAIMYFTVYWCCYISIGEYCNW